MNALVVLSLELPSPDAVVDVLQAIDPPNLPRARRLRPGRAPPNLPHFSGEARIVVDPHATAVTEWLDGAS